MGAGLPIAALVGRADLMDAPAVGGLGGTYGGNPLACAAALAAIQVMRRDDYAARARDVGARARALRSLPRRYGIVGDVRGLGAMVAFEVVRDPAGHEPAGDLAAHIVQAAYQGGLILVKAGFHGNVIRFLAPLCIGADELGRGLDILERAVAQAQDLADAERREPLEEPDMHTLLKLRNARKVVSQLGPRVRAWKCWCCRTCTPTTTRSRWPLPWTRRVRR